MSVFVPCRQTDAVMNLRNELHKYFVPDKRVKRGFLLSCVMNISFGGYFDSDGVIICHN